MSAVIASVESALNRTNEIGLAFPLTIGAILAVLSAAIICLKIYSNSTTKTLKGSDAHKIASFLISRESERQSISHALQEPSLNFKTFLDLMENDFPKAKFTDEKHKNVIAAVFGHLCEYGKLRRDLVALRDSEGTVEDVRMLGGVIFGPDVPMAEWNWETIGYQRAESPITDFRAAGRAAPVMLAATKALWPEGVAEMLTANEEARPYFFGIANLAIAFFTIKEIEEMRPAIVDYIVCKEPRLVGSPYGPFPAPGARQRDGEPSRMSLRYAELHVTLCREWDVFFLASASGIMEMQSLLDKFLTSYAPKLIRELANKK